jgi:hypothetical protein
MLIKVKLKADVATAFTALSDIEVLKVLDPHNKNVQILK